MDNVQIRELSAVLLAGGKSVRMGRDKALMPIDGVPLIQRLARELHPLTDNIFISANDPVPYDFLGLPIIPDLFQGQGPLAGLHAAFLQSDRPLMLSLACDLPRVRHTLLRRIVEAIADYDAVLPKTSDSGVHPLCAVYRRTCLPGIEANLRAQRNKMTDIFVTEELKVRYLDKESGCFEDQELFNLNYPSDLEILQ